MTRPTAQQRRVILGLLGEAHEVTLEELETMIQAHRRHENAAFEQAAMEAGHSAELVGAVIDALAQNDWAKAEELLGIHP